jgi:hypothetical protein
MQNKRASMFSSFTIGSFVVAGIAFVVLLLMLPLSSSNLGDLVLSLISESIGILVTVLWLDRLMQSREESRWEPAKHILYGQLTALTGKLYARMLPSRYVKWSETIYQFGRVSGDLITDAENGETKADKQALLAGIKEIVNIGKDKLVETLPPLAKEVDDLLIRTPRLVEPEILAVLMDIRHELTMVIESALIADWSKDEHLVEGMSHTIIEVVENVTALRSWLRQRADRVYTYGQSRSELRLSRPKK